ncbi:MULTISPECIES: type IV pilus assembly protein PilM [unclassified Cryobacterium]|uniref:type IV pilus assembly protein PilM n=1 Tax=unclassified Cryobacterium TaxID=2649013 RepID=UPI002AB54C1D|nr:MULTISPECIES: type IV pilus assembly protein PilM [unclassified Cryobacterium]MDY7529126.1 type IV pilus assembly protein PilM [Cryobacterium sp. 10C2]MDY7558711.1 type IV pilus assembly protein PilM [Cryobacterium sp. 10C3]MEB0201918.1 type IV pilus assembly protein PilM [Cryobacterium sp. 5I3]MEB0291784.1 type IV pilus assembly protein PilM [Cryobacterium sp. 10C2]
MTTSIVGIDIGSSVLRAVEVSDPQSVKPILLRYSQIGLPDGAVNSGEVIEPNTVAAALKQLWSSGGFKSKNVVLGMGNQRVLARDLSVPKMSLARIRETLPFEVQEMLPIPVAEALLDFYPISESEGENGPVVNGLLIAAVKSAVLANVKATQLAGLMTVDVDLIPFALTRILVSRPGIAGTVALVDIGGSTTSVVIATNGVPQFVRIIATGGDDISRALQDELKSTPEQAESAKCGLGLATGTVPEADKRAVEVIYKIASEQLTSLRNTISYFVNTRPTNPVGQIVLSGRGGQLRGLPEALAEMTRMPVVVGDPFVTVGLARDVDANDLRLSGSTFAVALGLALGSAA